MCFRVPRSESESLGHSEESPSAVVPHALDDEGDTSACCVCLRGRVALLANLLATGELRLFVFGSTPFLVYTLVVRGIRTSSPWFERFESNSDASFRAGCVPVFVLFYDVRALLTNRRVS